MSSFPMKSADLIDFRDTIIAWFEKHKRDLPWRHTDDPYSIWISEVMLQQTQVKTVLSYYERFLESFPTITDLSDADLEFVLKRWEGMGYYARARNLHKASGIISDKFNGRIPQDATSFRALPGAGEYITAAVLSRAFNKPLAVVDGNVRRVLARLFMIGDPMNSSKANHSFSAHATALLDQQRPGQFNEAMMELGATVCTPQRPDCLNCPINTFCKSFAEKKQMDFPKIAEKKRTPLLALVVSLIYKEDHFLIVRRPLDGLLGGLWELPGGQIEKNEHTADACTRRIKESMGFDIDVHEKIMQIHHAYSHFRVRIDVFRSIYKDGDIILKDHIDYRWIRLFEVGNFAFHIAHHKIFRKLNDG